MVFHHNRPIYIIVANVNYVPIMVNFIREVPFVLERSKEFLPLRKLY